MDNEVKNKFKEFVRRSKAVNNQTENKIDVLRTILVEYNAFCLSLKDFKGYPITMLIDDISNAKTKRKNVSQHYIHKEFIRIKENALFKIEHTVW